MGSTVVIYKSKYGSTKKYAQWIASELNAALFDVSEIRAQALENYDTIILGGGLYASGILGSEIITKNFDLLKGKNIVVFTVGLANPKLTDYTAIIGKNFPADIISAIKIFHLRGAMDYKTINLKHKAMMALLIKKIGKIDEQERDAEINLMLDTYGKTVDFTDEASIAELVRYCQAL